MRSEEDNIRNYSESKYGQTAESISELVPGGEFHLQGVVENILNFFVKVDQKGVFCYVSPSCKRVLGYEVNELQDCQGLNFVHPDDRDKIRAFYSRVMQTEGHAVEFPECRFKHAGGHYLWVEAVGESILDNNGRLKFIVIVIRDITRRKMQEEELIKTAKLESIALLAGGVAHDFNNLLAVILGNISLAKLSLNKPQQILDRLEKMEKATIQAKDLSIKMLAFSKGEFIKKEVIRLDRLIQEASYLALSGSNVRCLLFISEKLLPVKADAGQIGQVLNNILLNGVQAMPSGGTIRIKALNVEIGDDSEAQPVALPAGTYVKISVQDEGPGVPPELVERLFEPFYTTKKHGYGLGLATANFITQKHDGHITVDSQVGQGTTFHVYLPAFLEEVNPVVREKEEIITGGGKILLMDDNETVRDILGEMLEQLGYSVSFASSGRQAVSLYQRQLEAGDPFDVVIMDLTVPGGGGGKETVKQLSALDPQVKAVVTSGYTNKPVIENYRQYGFQDYIIKPYTIEALSGVLSRVLASGRYRGDTASRSNQIGRHPNERIIEEGF